MVSRKRTRSDNNDNGAPVQHHQDESPDQQQPQQFEEHGLLKRLRDSWEFANLMQFIQIFGQIFKIDENFDIEVCFSLLVSFVLLAERSCRNSLLTKSLC